MFSHDGKLVGLVTSNTRHAGSGRTFAKVNYSIASSALIPVVDAVSKQQTADIDWAALDSLDAATAAIWELRDNMQRTEKSQKGVQEFKEKLEMSVKKDIEGRSGNMQSKL